MIFFIYKINAGLKGLIIVILIYITLLIFMF